MSAATTRHAEPDQACAEAVDLARAAAEDDAAAGEVGAHVGIEIEADRIVTHLFACLSPGYVGWRWAVTVSRAARSKTVTVSESVLLPGPDSLLAPAWVPWTERVRPGDLKAGDLMPAGQDDERLVPVVAISGDAGLLDWDESEFWRLADTLAIGRLGQPGQVAEPPAVEAHAEVAVAEQGPGEEAVPGQQAEGQRAAEPPAEGQPAEGQLAAGLPAEGQPGAGPPAAGQVTSGQPQAAGSGRRGRKAGRARQRVEGAIRPARVLSAAGRDETAVRWYTGDHGPDSPLATAAPAGCLTCGFMIRLSGPLGRVFGVCANEYAPDDGKVVSVDHGCGAHSDGEMALANAAGSVPTVDELGYDMISQGAALPESVLETLDHELL